MRITQIKKAFNECKEKAKLDFAYTEALGDCNTCTWAEIESRDGASSKGIWLKYFKWGMNKKKFNTEQNYISHDLTGEQKDIVYDVLSKYFNVEWDKTDDTCILIKNKGGENDNVSAYISG